jgi:hypothetical protein
MHQKVFLKLKKTLKILSSGQIYKKPKKPTGLGFFLTGFFPTLLKMESWKAMDAPNRAMDDL